jgi:hypothetical protein
MGKAYNVKSSAETLRKPVHTIKALLALGVIAAFAILPGTSWARQSGTPSAASAAPSQGQTTSGANAGTSSATQQDPLAAAARKAKEQKSQAKAAKVFTNDNLPTTGISTVGATSSAASSDAAAAAPATANQGEKYWRDKFAGLNKKLAQDQSDLDVSQRELGQLSLQNYSDPTQAMQQGYSRSDIGKKTSEIAAKEKAVEDDKQALSDAEDDLRKSGGDSGWAR